MAAYEWAAIRETPKRGPKLRGPPGTFDRLVQDYFSAPEFLRLAPSTQKTYRSVIERLIEDEGIGHRLVREMTREHVRRILAKRSGTPGAANSVLQKLKVLIHFAIDNGWRKDDPTMIRNSPRVSSTPGPRRNWRSTSASGCSARPSALPMPCCSTRASAAPTSSAWREAT
jgi:hypothetical protein